MLNFDENLFKLPPDDCGVAPFWFLNGDLNDDELKRQLREMKKQGVTECILHARKGLETAYLSEEWFYKIGVILEECAALGMSAWIYDEDNWPSGYAGGRVVAENSAFAAECLTVEKIYPVLGEYIKVEKTDDEIECVVAVHSDSYFLDITDYENKCAKPWRSETLCWEVFVFRKQKCRHKPAYSPFPYVDLLNPEATKAFVRHTHAEYKKRFSRYFGSVIKGYFTDEPGFYQNYLAQCANLNTVAWTEDFASRFIEKFGYDIRPHLCCLWQDMGAVSVKTRCDYYRAVADFYKHSYFGVISDYIRPDGLKLIGHLHLEDQLETLVQTESDFFTAMDGMDIAGIDCIARTNRRITEKLGASSAHIRGTNICFSETFGGFGWNLTPQEMKNKTDEQFVQGVNMLVPHAFFYSIDGMRKTESPPSLFFQNGYWKYFNLYANYVRRLSYVGRAGKPVTDVAVCYPLKTSWARFMPLDRYEIKKLDEQILEIHKNLISSRFDYDFLDDVAFSSCSASCGKLVLNGNEYKAVVIPSVCVLPLTTVKILAAFAECGGAIAAMQGFSPVDEDGLAGEEYAACVAKIKEGKNYFEIKRYREEEVVSVVKKFVADSIVSGEASGVESMKRSDGEKLMRLYVNRTENKKAFVAEESGFDYAELWNAESGKITVASGRKTARGFAAEVALDSYGSVIVVYKKGKPSGNICAEKAAEYKNEKDITCGWFTGGKTVDKVSFHAAGLKNYSGEVAFEKTVTFEKAPARATLNLNGVTDYVSVTVNGKFAGVRLWTPYAFSLDGLLTRGENKIVLTVGNIMENLINGTDNDAGISGKITIEF